MASSRCAPMCGASSAMAGSRPRSVRIEGRSARKPSLEVTGGEARLADLPPSMGEVERSLEEGGVAEERGVVAEEVLDMGWMERGAVEVEWMEREVVALSSILEPRPRILSEKVLNYVPPI